MTEESTKRSTEIYIGTDSNLQNYLTSHSKTFYVMTTEIIGICLLAFLSIAFFILKYIEKLFINICEEDTPFTIENIRK